MRDQTYTLLYFKEDETGDKLPRLKENLMSLYGTNTDGRLQIHEVSSTTTSVWGNVCRMLKCETLDGVKLYAVSLVIDDLCNNTEGRFNCQ